MNGFKECIILSTVTLYHLEEFLVHAKVPWYLQALLYRGRDMVYHVRVIEPTSFCFSGLQWMLK